MALFATDLFESDLFNTDLFEQPAAPPVITTTGLPAPVQNVAYNFTLQADSIPAVTWTVSVGTLPTGMTLDANGLLHGTPTVIESKTFTVRATNADGFDEEVFNLNVTDGSASNFRSPLDSDLTRAIKSSLVVGVRE